MFIICISNGFFFDSPAGLPARPAEHFLELCLLVRPLQELIPTSNSNAVVSLTRLFESLLCDLVENEPSSKHIRVWIMVGCTLELVHSSRVKMRLTNHVGIEEAELFGG